MKRTLSQLLRTGAACGMLIVMNPLTPLAAIRPRFTIGTYVATITSESVSTNKSQNSEEVLTTAQVGNAYEVLEDLENGWIEIRVNDTEGYPPVSGDATVEEVVVDEMAGVQQDALESSSSYEGQQVVNYVMQPVGGRHRYGGSDSRTGVDCSGFTRYMLQSPAGVSMNRSSGGQTQQGMAIGADQMQSGDLLLYGNTRGVNHVAMYIRNRQIVHASTEHTSITISNWNYRNPVKIINVLGQIFKYNKRRALG